MEMAEEEITSVSVSHWDHFAGNFKALKQDSMHVHVTAAAKQMRG